MIKLEVANYCQDCPQFKPEVIERPQLEKLSGYDMMSGRTVKSTTFRGNTLIACRDRGRCEMVYKCISKAMEEQND